jgi:HAD superfamily hydrolase (TIGR01509 family)
MIKALIFDCFGVLYWDDLNRLYNLVHPDQFQDLKDLMHACDHGYMGRQDFLESVAELAGISVDAVAAVMHDKHRRNEPLIERAKELKANYRIGMISNMGYDMLNDLFSEQERSELFDDVVISSDVGLIKPSIDIFELALERLGVAADETVFIDDQCLSCPRLKRSDGGCLNCYPAERYV